jgi:PHD/YefM family antitoxin component YafN of YafNO toxin-antitoxin module
MSKIVQSSNLRNHLADVLNSVSGKQKYLLIARNQEINAAIVDIDFFEELLASLSPEYRKSIREARKNFEKGEVYSHEDVFGKL